MGNPWLARESETKGVGIEEAACREDPVPHHGVPKRPRIAEEPLVPDHQEEPDPQVETGFRTNSRSSMGAGSPHAVAAEGEPRREWDAHREVFDATRKLLSGQPGQRRDTT